MLCWSILHISLCSAGMTLGIIGAQPYSSGEPIADATARRAGTLTACSCPQLRGDGPSSSPQLPQLLGDGVRSLMANMP